MVFPYLGARVWELSEGDLALVVGGGVGAAVRLEELSTEAQAKLRPAAEGSCCLHASVHG